MLLEIENLEVRARPLGTPILRGISLAVDRGERVAIIGPSGSGKTTLFRTINGTVGVDGGCLRFMGHSLPECRGGALRELRRRIAVIAQKHDLVESLRVHQNVIAGALGRWSTGRAIRYLAWPMNEELMEAERALASVGLSHKLRAGTAALSGGEQQRVAIARALIQSPDLILADEPVASLDPPTAAEVLECLCGLAREKGMALLCSLHQPELAARYFDRTIEVRKGQAFERIQSHNERRTIAPSVVAAQ